MKQISKILIAFAFFIATSCDWIPGNQETPLSRMAQPPAGTLAPVFTLPNIANQQKSLNDYRGKRVILNFWALWCAPCVAELPALSTLQQQLNNSNTVVVAINVDAPNKKDEVIKYVQTHNFAFETLLDPELSTVNRYGVTGFPETVFIDENGYFFSIVDPDHRKLVTKFVGDRAWGNKEFVDLFRTDNP